MARWSQLRGFDPPPPGVRCWCWRCRGPGAAGGGPALCPPRSRAAGRGRTPEDKHGVVDSKGVAENYCCRFLCDSDSHNV